VLPTVDFDNQPRLQTNEIGDVAPDRHLPSKRRTIESMRSQPIPKLAFRIVMLLRSARAFVRLGFGTMRCGISTTLTPHPTAFGGRPPPQGGR
jgi:hypothetical protein